MLPLELRYGKIETKIETKVEKRAARTVAALARCRGGGGSGRHSLFRNGSDVTPHRVLRGSQGRESRSTSPSSLMRISDFCFSRRGIDSNSILGICVGRRTVSTRRAILRSRFRRATERVNGPDVLTRGQSDIPPIRVGRAGAQLCQVLGHGWRLFAWWTPNN